MSKEYDEDMNFDWMHGEFQQLMNEIRQELVLKCNLCRQYQEGILEAYVGSSLPETIMEMWKAHFREMHWNV